jgi:hypothetical protein
MQWLKRIIDHKPEWNISMAEDNVKKALGAL